jgi:hypothetical protein
LILFHWRTVRHGQQFKIEAKIIIRVCSALLPVSIEFLHGFHRWITGSFCRFISESFSCDVETEGNAHLLGWIDVMAGRRSHFSIPLLGAICPETDNYVFPGMRSTVSRSMPTSGIRCPGHRTLRSNVVPWAACTAFGSEINGHYPIQIQFSQGFATLLALPAQPLRRSYRQTRLSQMP